MKTIDISEIQEVISLPYVWGVLSSKDLPAPNQILSFLQQEINQDYKTRMKYFLITLKIGKELQRAQKALKKSKVLDIELLKTMCQFKNHPLSDEIKMNKYPFRHYLEKPEHVLIWNTIIEDFMILLTKHINKYFKHTYVSGRRFI